ncbi:MAG: amidohydrolase [Bacillota bacterium]|jgi:amidohydrolase|nr:amidohydrolase [Candidatus Fermentithermobacillaceae bacterium]
MTKEEIKRSVLEQIDKHREKIIELGQQIMANPELGYKEFKTSALVRESLTELGLEDITGGLAITGVSGVLSSGKAGPNVCIMGELDAVVCPGHPFADPVTGAAHACGHNGQVASMIGSAIGLVHSGAIAHLSGKITFLGVPAEEYVEVEYRQNLRKQGKISFLGGKQELLANGFFDDIDMAMMVHMASLKPGTKVVVGGTSNGFIGKLVKYRGKEAHAGGSPHMGINALNAALLGLMAVHLQRETFKDDDHIRVHPIITKGGDLVNVIPADVRIETYVRGKTLEAIQDANRKVTRALRAGAEAIGARVEIEDIPGYLPRVSNEMLDEVFRANAEALVGKHMVDSGTHGTGSSDMGDIMHLIPAIHPSCGGARGTAHSEEFVVDDPETAYIVPAKLLALTAIDLLWDDASLGREIVENFEPLMTKEEYLDAWERLTQDGD